jgi:hypothetical protein
MGCAKCADLFKETASVGEATRPMNTDNGRVRLLRTVVYGWHIKKFEQIFLLKRNFKPTQ